MKAIEPYFHVVLFIMLHKVVRTFKCVNETLQYDQSNESFSLCSSFLGYSLFSWALSFSVVLLYGVVCGVI